MMHNQLSLGITNAQTYNVLYVTEDRTRVWISQQPSGLVVTDKEDNNAVKLQIADTTHYDIQYTSESHISRRQQ